MLHLFSPVGAGINTLVNAVRVRGVFVVHAHEVRREALRALVPAGALPDDGSADIRTSFDWYWRLGLVLGCTPDVMVWPCLSLIPPLFIEGPADVVECIVPDKRVLIENLACEDGPLSEALDVALSVVDEFEDYVRNRTSVHGAALRVHRPASNAMTAGAFYSILQSRRPDVYAKLTAVA